MTAAYCSHANSTDTVAGAEKKCVSDEGEKGRAGSPLPAAARTECAPYPPRLTPYPEKRVAHGSQAWLF